MRSKTKIIVLHLKELIYTGILLLLGVGLLFLLLQTFLPKKTVPKPDYDKEASLYLPGNIPPPYSLAATMQMWRSSWTAPIFFPSVSSI